MPKRKRSKDVNEDLVTLRRKLKKLERKIRRRQSSASDSDSGGTSSPHTVLRSAVRLPESPRPTLNPDDWLPESTDHTTKDDNTNVSAAEPIDITGDPITATTPNDTEVGHNPTDLITNDTTASPIEPQELDEDVLGILGEDPTTETKYAKDVRTELASRLQHIAEEGLNKVNRKELLDKYPIPANCLHIGAPKLNPEIKAALPEPAQKRDKGIEAKQKQMTCAISCLAEVINTQLNSKNKNNDVLQKLMDVCRMLCDIQHADSATRRNYVLTSLKKDMKEHLTNTKIDTFLFGDKLSETIKSAKAVTKSGVELKADSGSKNMTKKTNTSAPKSLNRRAPAQARRPPSGPQRSLQSAAPRSLPAYYRTAWQPPPPPLPPPPPPPQPQAPPAHHAPSRPRRF